MKENIETKAPNTESPQDHLPLDSSSVSIRPPKWLLLDSALLLGYCSICPQSEYLQELLIDSQLKFEPATHNAIQSLITQMEVDARLQESNSEIQRHWKPDVMPQVQLTRICRPIFRNEIRKKVVELFHFGRLLGSTIGINFVLCNEPTSNEYKALFKATQALPETIQSAFDEIPKLISQSREHTLQVTLTKRSPWRSHILGDFGMLERISAKLRILRTSAINPLLPDSEETLRNLYFLLWYESKGTATNHSHAAIRDKWNSENPQATIGTYGKSSGRDGVAKGIIAAKKFLAKHPEVDLLTAIEALELQKI
jgi:hypothetical protein